jgi:hypothetical protein
MSDTEPHIQRTDKKLRASREEKEKLIEEFRAELLSRLETDLQEMVLSRVAELRREDEHKLQGMEARLGELGVTLEALSKETRNRAKQFWLAIILGAAAILVSLAVLVVVIVT